jgi:hypothetical protein
MLGDEVGMNPELILKVTFLMPIRLYCNFSKKRKLRRNECAS